MILTPHQGLLSDSNPAMFGSAEPWPVRLVGSALLLTVSHAKGGGGSAGSAPAASTATTRALDRQYQSRFRQMQKAMTSLMASQGEMADRMRSLAAPNTSTATPTYNAPTVPDPVAPGTLFTTGVAEAGLGARRKAARRKGFLSSVFAGDTGGFMG